MMCGMAYHHGDLRQALVAAAVEAIAEKGPAALSLRDLARRVGVSHAAPVHHFGDKAGLLAAVAVDGFRLLDEALRAAGPGLLDLGVAYVAFAVEHRAYFEVMFRPDLYRADDPAVVAARAKTGDSLSAGLAGREPSAGVASREPSAGVAGREPDRLAAWSIVHGLATLWLSGSLPPAAYEAGPRELARTVAGRLFARSP
jgi:AcrR family transcriptional regulator